MPSAYFDANIYDHIARGYVPIDEVDSIRGPLARRQILARLSLADIEELVGDWETNRSAAVKRLQVARDLVGFEDILKPPSDLLRGAIEAYAAARQAPSPVLSRRQQDAVSTSLHRIAAGETELDHTVSEIVSDVRSIKEKFRARWTDARSRAIAKLDLKARDPEEVRAVTFLALWETGALGWAEVFADELGVAEACRARGLGGLLEVRPVRLMVGAVMSMIYSTFSARAAVSLGRQRSAIPTTCGTRCSPRQRMSSSRVTSL